MKIEISDNKLVYILDDLKKTKEWSEEHEDSYFADGFLKGMIRMLYFVVGDAFDIVWREDKNYYELQAKES